ncbi:MAG: DUF3592 domain-containing protein [Chloroflexota bacterium]
MDTTFVLYFVVPFSLGALFFLGGGILLLINSRKNKGESDDETEGWLMTGGKILAARIEEQESKTSDASGTHIDISYEPIVEYAYNVNGVEYRGNKVFPGKSDSLGQQKAQEFMEKYPVNAYAPVRYDPKDPANSSLEEHGFHRPNRLLLAGQVLLAFGIMVCCFTSFMLFLLIGRVL